MPRNELFIGNLDRDVAQRDLEDIFYKYGKILRCDLKNRGAVDIFIFFKFIIKLTNLNYILIINVEKKTCNQVSAHAMLF